MPVEVINRSVVNRPRHEADDIRGYIEWQSPDEKVTHLEKVLTEHVFGRKLDAWDVRTTGLRYWVITNPTNYYSQELFPSLDYAFSFHVGVTLRVMAYENRAPTDPSKARLIKVWRKLAQASEAEEKAEEAEEFQTVGMRCRECLIALVRAISSDSMIPEGKDKPRRLVTLFNGQNLLQIRLRRVKVRRKFVPT